MFSSIIRQRLHNRLPEDSGEWMPVPVSFRRLPPPRDAKLKRKLRWYSIAHVIAQAAILALCTWAAVELLRGDDLPMLLFVATVVGLVTSLAFGAWLGRRYWLDTHDIISVTMRAQFWWFVLLLIPCYGWAVLLFLSLPCAMGSLIGGLIGGRLGQQQGAWK